MTEEPLEVRIAAMKQQLREMEARQQEDRHTTTADIGGLKYGIELLHRDGYEMRGALVAFRAEVEVEFGRINGVLAAHTRTLNEHTELLTEILRRLPPAP